jgi:glycosyltransferase involved in cell wall biosynthesis
MGERGYQFVKENFSREILAKRYLEIIQNLIKNKKS